MLVLGWDAAIQGGKHTRSASMNDTATYRSRVTGTWIRNITIEEIAPLLQHLSDELRCELLCKLGFFTPAKEEPMLTLSKMQCESL